MKVIQSIADIDLVSSGPSYAIPGICRGLMSAGVEVSLHTRRTLPPEDYHYTFPFVTYACKRSLILPCVSPEMKKGLARACQTADILQSNVLWKMPCVYPAAAVSGTRCKLVVAPHGTLATWALHKSYWKKKIFGWLFQNKVLRRADMFYATSLKECSEIRAAGYRQPVAVIPLGMDVPEVVSHVKEDAGRMRKVVFFGRLHKVKGVDRLLLAWQQVVRDGWELVVAGPDCGMLDTLKGIVADRKLPRVSFVGEIVGDTKYDFLAGGDIYVLPSDTENFGITVAEALVCGTPVIASQGTPWEGLEREKCGRWVPIGVEPLVSALKEMMSLDDVERAEMGARGKAWIRRDFSWEGFGVQMKAAYEWLLGKGPKPVCVHED